MSGIEVVGIVLGSIPLLISGLEHYAEGIRTMKNMWEYEAVIDHLVTIFTLDQAIFRHSCQELLMPILSDTQAAELLDGASPKWEDKDLDRRLQKRLGADYQAYTRSIRMLTRKIKLFNRKLGLDEKTMLPPWISNPESPDKTVRQHFFRHNWQKIKIGFDTPALNDLVEDMRRTINQIDRFTTSSTSFAPKRIAIEQRRNMGSWLQIRDDAKRLYESLNTKSRWSCNCPYPHRASLRLDARRGNEANQDTNTKFGVLFSFESVSETDAASSLPWVWRSLEIHTKQQCLTQTRLEPKVRPISSKRVSFIDPKVSKSPLPQNSGSAKANASSSIAEVEALCKALTKLPQGTDCLGYLGDTAFQHHLYHAPSNMSDQTAKEIICFHDLLRRQGQAGLGPKEKYKLALIVASAVLQLHATPWLRERWCLDDIHFLSNKDNSSFITRPYVSKIVALPGGAAQDQDPTDQPEAQAFNCIANEMMFALGVALIEISYGVPIIQLKKPGDIEIKGLTEFFIATRLVNQNEIRNRDHDKYAEVVLRCVKGQLSTLHTPLSLEETKVQQSFFDDVIIPLQEINDSLNA